MNFLERTMRVMTHLNVGATLATAAWLIWTGAQVVSGQWQMPRPSAAAYGHARQPLHTIQQDGPSTAPQSEDTWQQLPAAERPAAPHDACDCGEPHTSHRHGVPEAAATTPRT